MTSMWQRWTTPSSSDEFVPLEDEDAADYSNVLPLPKQVHVGLCIDSCSHKSETSSLSDFEEGMPVWAKDNTPPRNHVRTFHSNSLEDDGNIDDDDDEEEEEDCHQDEPPKDRPHTPLNHHLDNDNGDDPIGFQIPIPQRHRFAQQDSPHISTLTQRSKNSSPVVLPMILPMTSSQLRWRDDFQQQSHSKQTLRPQRLLRIFCTVLAVGFIGASVHQQLDSELWWDRQGGNLRQNLPSFEQTRPQQHQQQQKQAKLQLATFDTNNHQVRSNLAFARASSKLPVFGESDDELVSDISNSSPFVSFLGGCAFVAILLETGWKGYQKSKIQQPQRGQSQAVRRLYKQTN
ncbi:MAG: hypothetical protein SGBAC_012798 [Bacillariaceae sp.]